MNIYVHIEMYYDIYVYISYYNIYKTKQIPFIISVTLEHPDMVYHHHNKHGYSSCVLND